ncbi:major facilitator superfamily domain-containing protein [Trichoderma sp. SZMC 28013]
MEITPRVDDGQIPEADFAPIPTWQFWLLCCGVCSGLLLSIIDSSILATSLYTIGVEFQEHSLINWVVLAYTLGYTGFIVSCSTLSDIVGRRNAFAASYILFVSFSIACGFSKHVKWLIICRAFQGIGGSGLYALSMIILTQQCPPQLRQYIGSIIGMVIASAGILGPVLGGIFAEYTSWRWIFWMKSATPTWFAQSITPVFPIELLRNRRYARSTLTTFLLGYPHLLLIFLFPIRMQVVSDKSPLLAGLTLLPMLGTVAIGSMVSGKVNAVKDHLSGTLRCGSWLMGLGFVLLTTVRGPEDDAKALGFLAFVGFGFGLFTAAATNVISVDVLTRQKASAHGILAQARILGGSLGIAVSTLFLHTEVINRLPDILTPDELDFMEGDMKNLVGDSLEAVKKAYVSAFHKSITTAAVAACLAVLSTAFMSCHIRKRDIEQQLQATIPRDGQQRVAEPLIPLQDIAHSEEPMK